MGTVITFPGVPPPEPGPTFEEWYQSEFAEWFQDVEDMPAEREDFIAALEQIKERLNGWVVP